MPELHWIEKALRLSTIDDNGCWVSSYAVTDKGYSRVCVGGENIRLHRLSYNFFRGEIPEGMMVCHRCDVRNCWNPDHLFIGTAQDNYRDMVDKGRRADPVPVSLKGSENPGALLNEENVREIRRRFSAGESGTSLAKEFGVHQTTVSLIIRRKTWSCVADDDPHVQSSPGT